MRHYVKINHLDPDTPFSVVAIDREGTERLFDVFKSRRQAQEVADYMNGVDDD